MIGFVFLSLFVMTAVVGGVFLLMFADVAFAGPHAAQYASSGARIARPAGNVDGAGLALRVEQAVSRAVASLGMKTAEAATCDAACHQREIYVTTPETLAIVQELRERHSPAQVNAIRSRAQQNVAAHNGAHTCPLLLSGGFCACEMSRPVSCRTCCVAGADSPVEARVLAESVGTGAADILRDCLQASGLDGAPYELNHAIVKALDTPHAARHWARGEHILESAANSRA